MCKQKITLKKFLKLIFEIWFYNIVITLIFSISGYEQFSLNQLINGLLIVRFLGNTFVSAFIIFYLLIPFLNILIKNINERKHIAITILLILVYSAIATIPKFRVTFNYVSWFVVLYFISSYIRLYPKKIWTNKKLWWSLTLVCVAICILSIIFMSYSSCLNNTFSVYRFVTDSNQFLALITAVCSFLAFKNLNIKNSKIINTIAASTFGVLLIHSNSYTMSRLLWVDLFKSCDAFYFDGFAAVLHPVFSVICVFSACIIIDILRKKLLEEPLFKILDNKLTKAQKKIEKFFKDERSTNS